jgi:hypothetical protein
MYCPNCACEAVSDETKFCSKCGFTLNVVRNIVENNGEDQSEISQFQKGVRFGVKLLLIALILLPVFQILGGFFTPDDKLVESSSSSSWFDLLGNAVLITLTFSGIARIFYAILFERSAKSNISTTPSIKEIFGREKNALPPSSATPVSDFGKWKTSGELFEPIFNKPKTSGDLR